MIQILLQRPESPLFSIYRSGIKKNGQTLLSTVFDVIDAGKYVVYLTDAVAGIDDETEKAVMKVLEGLQPLHVQFMTTEDYLNCRSM